MFMRDSIQHEMPQLTKTRKARKTQLEAACDKKNNQRTGGNDAAMVPKVMMRVLKGREAGWVGEDEESSEYSESEGAVHTQGNYPDIILQVDSESEYEINSEEDEEGSEGIDKEGLELRGSEVAIDVLFTPTGFMTTVEGKTAFEMLDMYNEEETKLEEKERKKRKKNMVQSQRQLSTGRKRKQESRQKQDQLHIQSVNYLNSNVYLALV
ncbi:hypothetical protein L873DRAFT_1931595 [Choiromyces venosus 120613-1]|uniref:Uncharacterized protein n=1 Tax=Choiromyces venosus 120613-1 TaxID=1336337 RepID=A0A3N4JG94_9PEZI|nr:hypothetical protein L873DRAFT_1931595 [Choiromyces venosus 120613-1]